MGCPIRKSTDRSLFAAPRGLSQRTTSFIASCHQGIHQMPLSRLIALIINAHPSAEEASPKACQRALTKRPDHSEKNPAPARLGGRWPFGSRSRGPGKSPIHDFKIGRKLSFRISETTSPKLVFFPQSISGWWSLPGSNRRPEACKATALPAELRPRNSSTATPL